MPTRKELLNAHLNELVRQETLNSMVGKTISTGPIPVSDLVRQEYWKKWAELLHSDPSDPPPPAPAPSSPVLDRIEMDWSPIVFSSGTPVGGWAHATLYPDGRTVFTGHFHDSGAISFNDTVSFAIISSKGTVFTISHSGTLHGTFDPGSRDDDWTEGSTHGELAAAWRDLSDGYTWHGSAGVNWTIQQTVDNAIAALKTVGPVIVAVVALL